MRWDGRRESDNIEDRRSESPPEQYQGGGGRFSPLSIPMSGKARLILIIVVIGGALLTGNNPLRWLNGDFSSTPQIETSAQGNENDDAKRFVAVVLGDTEEVWTQVFQEQGKTYEFPKLVLFRNAIATGCGYAGSAVGPFYCPNDSKLYLDLGFLSQLQRQLGAQGDFAEAYVIAHEVGHHVQHLLGNLKTGLTEGSSGSEVRTELQADCYAGIWAKRTDQIEHSLEPGDIDEAINAASAVGDDRLQKREQGVVVPDSFTHGTSVQRQRWFKRGYDGGNLDACDTFSAKTL